MSLACGDAPTAILIVSPERFGGAKEAAAPADAAGALDAAAADAAAEAAALAGAAAEAAGADDAGAAEAGAGVLFVAEQAATSIPTAAIVKTRAARPGSAAFPLVVLIGSPFSSRAASGVEAGTQANPRTVPSTWSRISATTGFCSRST